MSDAAVLLEPSALAGARARWNAVRVLEGRIAGICGHLNVLHAELVDAVAEALATDAWQGDGILSPEHWVGVHTGMSRQRARQIVRMARRRHLLPETHAKFAAGEISVDQMAVVASKVPGYQDGDAAALAPVCTVEQLRSTFSRNRVQPPPDEPGGPEPDASAAELEPDVVESWLSVGRDDDGNLTIHGLAHVDDGAVIEQALREAKDALYRSGNRQATWLDALVEVCERSLGTITVLSRRDLFRAYVHLDTEGAFFHNGPPLPPWLLDTLMCDGILQPVWETDGIPISIGRRQHTVPPHTRRMVEHRDRHCRHPGCSSHHGTNVHHIIGWAPPANGPTDTHNLVLLCRKHHRELHKGAFRIAGNADTPNGLTFTNRHGQPIVGHHPPRPPTGPPPDPARPYEHPPGTPLQRTWITFTPPPTRPRPPPDTDAA